MKNLLRFFLIIIVLFLLNGSACEEDPEKKRQREEARARSEQARKKKEDHKTKFEKKIDEIIEDLRISEEEIKEIDDLSKNKILTQNDYNDIKTKVFRKVFSKSTKDRRLNPTERTSLIQIAEKLKIPEESRLKKEISYFTELYNIENGRELRELDAPINLYGDEKAYCIADVELYIRKRFQKRINNRNSRQRPRKTNNRNSRQRPRYRWVYKDVWDTDNKGKFFLTNKRFGYIYKTFPNVFELKDAAIIKDLKDKELRFTHKGKRKQLRFISSRDSERCKLVLIRIMSEAE